nr:MAG TPA: helix-turn-helix XRE-family like protein [Caudoviricetes sp.]
MDKSPIVIRINSLLAKKGITKAEFYEKCALTSASYSQWNTGKTKPRLQTIERIAEFLDVPSEYLLYGDAPAASEGAKKALTKTGERENNNPVTQEIFEFVRSASVEELAEVVRYIQFLKTKRMAK